jgi:hypothetical protein
VLLDGASVKSCTLLAAQADGGEVTSACATARGLGMTDRTSIIAASRSSVYQTAADGVVRASATPTRPLTPDLRSHRAVAAPRLSEAYLLIR